MCVGFYQLAVCVCVCVRGAALGIFFIEGAPSLPAYAYSPPPQPPPAGKGNKKKVHAGPADTAAAKKKKKKAKERGALAGVAGHLPGDANAHFM